MARDEDKNAPSSVENESFAARLKQKYGEGVDPEVSLDRPGSEASSGASSELLGRLADHGLKQSRYRLEGEVARGGMGAILKVWDEDLRRTLAMKVILGKGESPAEGGTPAVDPRMLGRFLEEAQVTGQLDHPGIVPVHELGLDSDGRVYFTMKLVKGRDLKQIFDLVFAAKEGWNETRALGAILRVCEAMAYAHAKGVIHRDLKPANVMVGNFGEVYVMDWGLSRVLGRKDTQDIRLKPEFMTSLQSVKTERREEREESADSPLVTMDGDVMGTPSYMPPEQARGEIEKLSARSDVYAIGAMLYHLLARQTPYVPPGARISNRTVLMAVVHGPPKPVHEINAEVPAELVAICEKAMSRDPSARYADTLALAEDLRAYLEHRVVAAYETGAVAEMKKWVQRNKPLAASIAAALLIAIGGLTWVSLVQSRAKAEIELKNEDLTIAKATAEKNEQRALAGEALAKTNAELAEERRMTAEANEAEARREKSNVLRLSAFQTLDDLTKEADALWPAAPGMVERYRVWMTRAETLVAKIPEFRETLVEIEARALPQSAHEHEAEVAQQREWRFAEENDRWWYAQMEKLVAALTAFADEKGGLMRGISAEHGWGIAKRMDFATSIEERSVTGAEATRRWADAIDSISYPPECPLYEGLVISPQLGLLPLGADPESRLWEFAHLQSGEPAVRGSDGKLELTEESGLVFVLIPGGTFLMGEQSTDPGGRHYDPQAWADTSPVHEVRLSPYFLSKYEMTQGQWLRFTDRNPSQYQPGTNYHVGQRHTLLHPVERVTWTQCVEVLTRVGLSLPSEAQWENGCRGGTDTSWWTGSDRESLRGNVNLADQTAARAGTGWQEIKDWPDLEDGWVVHAPVGSFPANPFGLHEVHGNVWEWCLDGYAGYLASSQLDPLAPWSGAHEIVYRGGSFINAASSALSANRGFRPPDSDNVDLGLRPAMGITTR